MKSVWVATLERFGYTLLVVEQTKQKAMDAMKGEYIEKYFKINRDFGQMPFTSVEEMMEQDEEFKECYEVAMEEIYIRRLELGKVEWC